MATQSIVFVDSRVSNYQSLIDSLTELAEVLVLDVESDGLTQMADWLSGRTGIDAIHVVSHGSVGALYLGNTVLNGGNLASYTQVNDMLVQPDGNGVDVGLLGVMEESGGADWGGLMGE